MSGLVVPNELFKFGFSGPLYFFNCTILSTYVKHLFSKC